MSVMSRPKGKAQAKQSSATRPRMHIYRSKSVPDAYATELLHDGTLLKHVQDHIVRFGESKTGEYNVKVSGSGYIIVGARS
jgi:hypothetical protein